MRIKLDEGIVTTILTNHHVLKSEEMAAEASTTFNYDGRGEPMVIKLCPNIFFRTSQVSFFLVHKLVNYYGNHRVF